MPQFLTDGRQWRGVVWNASPDAIGAFLVHPPAEMGEVRTATQVIADGERLPARVEGEQVRLPRPVQQWEFVVLG